MKDLYSFKTTLKPHPSYLHVNESLIKEHPSVHSFISLLFFMFTFIAALLLIVRVV